MSNKKVIKEKAREILVFREVDVLVSGGGTAGMVAGLAAARRGVKTLVIEKLNCLGGNFTAGLMTSCWALNDQEKLVVRGIPLEIMERLITENAVIPGDITKDAFIFYDTEMAKIILVDMYSKEPNLEVLFDTVISEVIVEGNEVKGVIIESKSGRQAVLAKAIVDATGDADIAARAGAEFKISLKDKLHPVSLLAKFGNVDIDEMLRYYKEHPDYADISGFPTFGWQLSSFFKFKITQELKDVQLSPKLKYLRDWFILFGQTPRPGEIYFNMTGEINVDGTDIEDLSRGELASRKKLLEGLEVFKRYIPGFKDAYIMATASKLGVRETRRIVGEHEVTLEDISTNRRFPDAVGTFASPVGVHTPDGKGVKFGSKLTPGTSYELPYGCMIPKKIEGIVVTGRAISVVVEAIGSTRNMSCCMVLGQAAGVAAALASEERIVLREVKISKLRRALIEQGVYFEDI